MKLNVKVATQLEALGHPVRLGIVTQLVRSGPKGMAAGKIGGKLAVASNALTFHLHKLKAVNLVTSWRQGQQIIYCIAFKKLHAMVNFLIGACCIESDEKCGDQCTTTLPSGAVCCNENDEKCTITFPTVS